MLCLGSIRVVVYTGFWAMCGKGNNGRTDELGKVYYILLEVWANEGQEMGVCRVHRKRRDQLDKGFEGLESKRRVVLKKKKTRQEPCVHRKQKQIDGGL